MQVLQNMDMNQFVIVVPTALIAMYVIITLQKSLSERENKYIGLILPAISFVASTVLAFRPLFIMDGESDGLFMFCLRMWVTFNLVTVVFLFPYLRQRGLKKRMAKAMVEAEAQPDIIDDKPADNIDKL